MLKDLADKSSVLFSGLSGYWQRFFKDWKDIQAYYQSSETYLGQVYLDLMAAVLNLGAVDTPIFNTEDWKLFTILETELNFKMGVNANEDRYLYDMPGDIVTIDLLQNTILSPTIAYERGVDFDVEDDDGFARFREDPFREFQDTTGEWLPQPGVAWRSVQIAVGNNFVNTAQTLYGVPENYTAYDDGIRRGDTLRLLARRGAEITSGTAGSISPIAGGYMFFGTGVEAAKPGDIIHVYDQDGGAGHVDEAYRDFYIVKRIFTNPSVPNQAELVAKSVHNTNPAGSTTNLSWRLYSGIAFEDFLDYEVDYIDGLRLVGAAGNAYPLDLTGPFSYSIVRTPANPDVYNVPLNFVTAPVPAPDLPYVPNPPYSPSNPPPEYTTDLGYRHLVPGSVVVVAKKADGSGDPVEEGVDYTVDYLRGKIYQTTYWSDGSYGRCNFQYMEEVYLSGSGEVSLQTIGTVKQLSFWCPTVVVDRFNLWYNYGSMLNRFEASSEQYKAFLLGIMYLYVTGPILQRIEAALNVAAGYPVIEQDGEVLTGYDDGVNAQGADAEIVSATKTVILDPLEHVLSELDVGGYIVFSDPASDANKGRFQIVEIDTSTNTAELVSDFDLVDETGVAWVITHNYLKIVTTNRRTYEYPFNVPIREDVQDELNFGALTFEAFEPLTEAFRVTDYLEDPQWWVDRQIPQILWPQVVPEDAPRVRRRAAKQLYEHVIGADDFACIGDPGLYIGADESGTVLTPNDNSGGPGIGDPVPIHRHNAAYVIFDQYLKMHMFYISFSPDLELDSDFKSDLEDIVLVAKPSWTYPNVDLNDIYIDNVTLYDIFDIPEIDFDFGEDGGENIYLANNELYIGDEEAPWYIGDFFKYDDAPDQLTAGTYPDPIPPGTQFIIPGVPAGASLLTHTVHCQRTSDGKEAIEGRDYTINLMAEDPPGTPNPVAWQVTFLTECARVATPGLVIKCSAWYAERLNGAYDTTLGWTPVFIGGWNPWYIRHTALDPSSPSYAAEWDALRSEHVDRPVQITIDDSGGSYTYP